MGTTGCWLLQRKYELTNIYLIELVVVFGAIQVWRILFNSYEFDAAQAPPLAWLLLKPGTLPCDFRLLLDAETTKRRKSHGVCAPKTIVVRWFYKRDTCWTDSKIESVQQLSLGVCGSKTSVASTDQSQFRIFVTHSWHKLSVKMAKVHAEHNTWARLATGYGGALLGKTACSTGYGVIITGLSKSKKC